LFSRATGKSSHEFLSAPGQFLFDEPANSKYYHPDPRIAEFGGERIFRYADNQAIEHFKEADSLNDLGNNPDCAIQESDPPFKVIAQLRVGCHSGGIFLI
jgi:hypothetical protein